MANYKLISELFDLRKKVILFTGGYGYLGTSAVKALSMHGATVYVLGKSQDKFESQFKGLVNIKFIYFDLSNTSLIKESFKEIWKIEGRIDVLVNNAFYLRGNSPEEMTDEDFSYGIEGVLSRYFSCIREIIPYYKQQRFGKIINVSSMYGLVAPDFELYQDSPSFLNPPHYGIAKAGIIQLTKYYASYLGKFAIQVNCITPGPFPSVKVQKDKAFLNRLQSKTLLNTIGSPQDLAGSFVFLASPAANFITGQNIIVDGGWTTT